MIGCMVFGALAYGGSEMFIHGVGSRVYRAAAFGCLGYGPLSSVYYPLCHKLTKSIGNQSVQIACKILVDQTFWSGLWNAMYLGVTDDNPLDSITRLSLPLLYDGWKIWPLIHIVTYKYIPPHLIVYWVGTVDILWACVLSRARSITLSEKENDHDDQESQDVQTNKGE